ncbi:hypothetical protein [Streptomyces sp. H51]|uniref:hypothetical protein n=1 Tax=Streptomyces sp. H51 TaxID=3111770 RepID=UPI002D7761F0|nr:hypothetical protein [Streptomyces sp. H51]
MKKRSMLAIASLVTGFVVAAVTPSHADATHGVADLNVPDTVGGVDHTVALDSPAPDDLAAGKDG